MSNEKEYKKLLTTIKQKVQEAQLKTVVAANGQMLLLYWQLGNYILHNQHVEGWGAKIIEKLSADLKKDFPNIKGLSTRNMLYMKQFAKAYPFHILEAFTLFEKELKSAGTFTQPLVAQMLSIENNALAITQQPVAQLEEVCFLNSIVSRVSWSHHVVLLDKIAHRAAQLWYMMQSIENGMSRNILAMQIESGLFERQIKTKKLSNFHRTLPAPQTDFAHYILKDPYIFDFVQAKDKADERNIEQQLTEHITKFLLELGQGFAFIGRQVHFEVGGSDFFIDLLFYHTRLHAYVVIELKTKEFTPGDAGQLNFYINLVNDKLKGSNDADTIGILLCKGKNEVLAEYALKSINQPIGVSDYQLSRAIPKELKSQLPDVIELEQELLKNDEE